MRRLLDHVVARLYVRALGALGLITPDVKPRKSKG